MPGSTTDAETENGGVLTLAAVPIGRADDASARLVAELAGASLIAAEDTRRVRWLASSLNIELKARVVSYYDAVETRRTAELLGIQAGLQPEYRAESAGGVLLRRGRDAPYRRTAR